jgi:hypothetical protein
MGTQEIREGVLNYVDSDYGVDMLMIYNTAEVVGDITGIILGVIAYGIVIFMTLITAIDVAYINLPVFRGVIKNLRWDGTNGRGLSAISKDALSSVEESLTVNLEKSALAIYVSKRMVSYVLAVFVLFLIVGGMGYIKDIVVLIVRSILLATMGG